MIRPADALQEGLEEQIRRLVGLGVVLHHGDLEWAQGLEEAGGGVPLVHQDRAAAGFEGIGPGGVEGLTEVPRLAGQGLVQEGMGPAPHTAGPIIAGDGDADLATQGAPGLLEGEGPGHMAQSDTLVGVDTEDQMGGHGAESLTAQNM